MLLKAFLGLGMVEWMLKLDVLDEHVFQSCALFIRSMSMRSVDSTLRRGSVTQTPEELEKMVLLQDVK